MFGWFKKPQVQHSLEKPVFLYNTLTGTKEAFKPLGRTVRMYNCGPTVYDRQHIGNLSAAVFADVIGRMLIYNGFKVKQAINITDFGHLVSDADEGEDKMTKALRREKLPITMANMKILADRYTEQYLGDIRALGVDTERIVFPRASEYVGAQIALIKTLTEKGYTYDTPDGLYFETSRFPSYGALGNVRAQKLQEGARVATNTSKRSSTDFVLWKKDLLCGWQSPWGMGFPGWHIECSAMIRATLGEQIDIHTGGIEHVPIHHNNEIAQSEAATGRAPFVKYWMHRAHIQIDGHKIAKSEGNSIFLEDIVSRHFHPLALRYWFLTSHYSTPANFVWEALDGATKAFFELHQFVAMHRTNDGAVPLHWKERFQMYINDNLDTPKAIALLWEMLKDTAVSNADKAALLCDADRVLGIGLESPPDEIVAFVKKSVPTAVDAANIPAQLQTLLDERDAARSAKDWTKADVIRAQIEEKGFLLVDTASGAKLQKKYP
ncbi:MAG: cysteine--tRNA ligase [Patescibacteria group bacterium]